MELNNMELNNIKEFELVLHNIVILKDFSVIERYITEVLKDHNWSFAWVTDENRPTKLEVRITLTHSTFISITITEDCERFNMGI